MSDCALPMLLCGGICCDVRQCIVLTCGRLLLTIHILLQSNVPGSQVIYALNYTQYYGERTVSWANQRCPHDERTGRAISVISDASIVPLAVQHKINCALSGSTRSPLPPLPFMMRVRSARNGDSASSQMPHFECGVYGSSKSGKDLCKFVVKTICKCASR